MRFLPPGVVHTGLAAHRRVHLSQEGGRDLDVADAPLVTGGRESRDIADHAPAERQHDGVAVQLLADELVEHPAGGLERLVLLAVRENAFEDASLAEPRAQSLKVQPRHRGVGHDHHIASRSLGIDQRPIGEQSRTDRDEILRVPDV